MLPPVSVPMPAQKMPGGDAVRGSRARSPGPSVECPRVARDGKWLGRVGEPDRELHGRGLPRDHGAGGTQARDDNRVITLAPPRIEHEALRRCGEVDRGHDVFDADGDAVQRAAVVSRLELGVGLLRGLQRGVVGPTQVRPELLVEVGRRVRSMPGSARRSRQSRHGARRRLQRACRGCRSRLVPEVELVHAIGLGSQERVHHHKQRHLVRCRRDVRLGQPRSHERLCCVVHTAMIAPVVAVRFGRWRARW